ncbi:MAG: LysR family transcriptional regulator [Myxococcota bacterium]
MHPSIEPEQLSLAVTFACVVHEGSFRRAAARLGVARSTVSERVARLEEGLGVRLLQRTTRQVHLTRDGEVLLRTIDRIVEQWSATRCVLETRLERPSGTLRVTAPETLSDLLVAPVAAQMLEEFPDLSVELLPNDAILDLVSTGIDVALRVGRLADSSLIARRLGTEHTWVAVSSKSPFAQTLREARTVDETLACLAALPWVGYLKASSSIVVSVRGDAPSIPLQVHYRAQASTGYGLMRLVMEGVGVGILPDSMMRLGGDTLITPLPENPIHALALWAVVPSRHALPARTQIFLERIERMFEQAIWTPPQLQVG